MSKVFVLKKKKEKYDKIDYKNRKRMESWREELIDLTTTYYNLEDGQRDVRKKHGSVFELLEDLETKKEEVRIRIQDIARRKSQQGRTVSLVNLPEIMVYVCGNEKKQQYDLGKARKYWDEEVLLQVLEVNPDKVEQLLKDGYEGFSEKLADRAKLPREASTPAVNIRVKKKY